MKRERKCKNVRETEVGEVLKRRERERKREREESVCVCVRERGKERVCMCD